MFIYFIYGYATSVILSFILLPLLFSFFEKRPDIFKTEELWSWFSKKEYIWIVSSIPLLNLLITGSLIHMVIVFKIRMYLAILTLRRLCKKIENLLVKERLTKLINELKEKS